MSGELPSKQDLEKIISFHEQALVMIPENDSMYGRMSRMLDNLKHRLEVFDEFKINPYTTHTSLPKFNSDDELGLGDYHGESLSGS